MHEICGKHDKLLGGVC